MTTTVPTKLLRRGFVGLLVGLPVIGRAGQPSSAASEPGRAASAPAVTPPIAGRALLGITVAETSLVATGWRATKLLKADVHNDKNQKIGKIDDLVVATDGTLTIAVVNVSTFLGLPKHLVAIPVRQFKEIAPKAILPNATKDELKSLPKFQYTA